MTQHAGKARVLVTLGHGRPQGLAHHLVRVGLAELDRLGVEHRVQDLLAEGFDPVLRLEPSQHHARPCPLEQDRIVHGYQEDLRWANRHLIVHPVWWFSPPAILKGWVDRVLAEGLAFRHPPGGTPEGLLVGRRALVVQTFNSTRLVDRVLTGGLAGAFWRRGVFGPLGVPSRRLAIYGAERLEGETLSGELRRLRRALRRLVE